MRESKESLWNKNFIQCCISYFFLNFSYQMLVPIIPLYLIDKLGVMPGKTGVVLASYTAGVLCVRPFSGYLVDCFNRKKLYVLAFFLFAAMFMGYWIAAVPLSMMVVRFIQGSFMGVASVAGNTIAIDVIPSSRRAEGMGVYGLAINLAMALAQFTAVAIFDLLGFEMLVSAALLLSLIGGYSVTQIKYPSRAPIEKPLFSLDRFILIKALPAALCFIFLEAPYGMLLSFAVVYGKDLGVENPSYFFVFMAAGVATARLISGRLVDGGKVHLVSYCAISSLIVSFLLLSFATSTPFFYGAGLLIGLGFGVCVPAFQSLFVNVAPHNMRGTATSTYLSSFDLGSGMGMILAGYIAQYLSLADIYRAGAFLTLISLLLYIFKVRKSYDKNVLID